MTSSSATYFVSAYYGKVTIGRSALDPTVSTAATILIQDAPETASGITSVTNPYALLVLNGTSRFEGDLESSRQTKISGSFQTGVTTLAGSSPVSLDTTTKPTIEITGSHTTVKIVTLPSSVTTGTVYNFINSSNGTVQILNSDTSIAGLVSPGESKRVTCSAASSLTTRVPGTSTWTDTSLQTTSAIINLTSLTNLYSNSSTAALVTNTAFRAPSLIVNGAVEIQVGKNTLDYGILRYTYAGSGLPTNRISLGTTDKPESFYVYNNGVAEVSALSSSNHALIVSNLSATSSVKTGAFLAPFITFPGSNYIVLGQGETAYNAGIISFNCTTTSSPLSYIGIGVVGGLDPTIKIDGNGVSTFTNTNDSTSLITGGTYFSGGVVFEKNISVGGSLGLHGTTGRIKIEALNGTWTFTLPSTAGTAGQVLTSSGGAQTGWSTPGSGTVTSVNLTAPSFLSVGGTAPITTSGTIALTYSGTPLPVLNGGTGTTTSTGTGSTVLSASPTLTGTATFSNISTSFITVSGVSASQAVQTNASKDLITIANTGTGNNVLSDSPTFTGSILGILKTNNSSIAISNTVCKQRGDHSNQSYSLAGSSDKCLTTAYFNCKYRNWKQCTRYLPNSSNSKYWCSKRNLSKFVWPDCFLISSD